MSRFKSNIALSNLGSAKTGVLLTNLGTPEAPTTSALRKYLREFLSDPRVVEIPRILWLTILYGVILLLRPAKSAKLYKSIWSALGSPLLVISRQQQEKVAKQLLDTYGDNVVVELGMRYGQPSISKALCRLQSLGVRNIIVLPLYPQYASPTTGSTFDALAKEVKNWRWVPNLHFVSGYHDHPLYVNALANSINEHIAKHGKPEKFVLSYHGMPELFYQWGDPYFDFCHKTTELLAAKLNWSFDDYVMTFQSRFGKAEWLKPYTDATLASLPAQDCKNIAIISPAFSADCLETLEELEKENREVFIEAGGTQYHYIPALNDRDDHVQALVNILTPLINIYTQIESE